MDEESRLNVELNDEAAFQWDFLEAESDACAVLTERMEMLYLNAAGRDWVEQDWFGKHCWEVFPTRQKNCVFRCATIQALGRGDEAKFHTETLLRKDGSSIKLGIGWIPLSARAGDKAAAMMLLRPCADEDDEGGEPAFKEKLLEAATLLKARIVAER